MSQVSKVAQKISYKTKTRLRPYYPSQIISDVLSVTRTCIVSSYHRMHSLIHCDTWRYNNEVRIPNTKLSFHKAR